MSFIQCNKGRPSGAFLRAGAVCFVLVGASFSLDAQDAPDRPPNFIIIFADDLGYGDLGCFGSEHHRTPRLDRMAAEGMRLTSFYSTSGVCTPSRSSLMTGCYPQRVGLGVNARSTSSGRMRQVLFPIARKGLHPDEITIAEILKTRGYATACIGKWHLGDQPEFLPTRQGFDEYFGIPYSNDMMPSARPEYPPLPLMRGEKVAEAPAEQSTLTKRYAEEAVRFIEAHRDEPFFIYLPHSMPHNPVHSSPAFAGKSANGGYGDAIEEIDWATGEILDTLERLELDDNTLVIFTSDNGAARRHGGSNGALRGWKGSTWEGGMRVPMIARWPGRVPAGESSDLPVTTMELLPTLASLAGTEAPQDRVIDGRDVAPILLGESNATAPSDAFYFYMKDQIQAVRAGRWKLHLGLEAKLVSVARGDTEPSEEMLFDLEADAGEQINLASEHPDIVKRLEALAERARWDLGDFSRPGRGQRSAGHVDEPRPMVFDRAGPNP